MGVVKFHVLTELQLFFVVISYYERVGARMEREIIDTEDI